MCQSFDKTIVYRIKFPPRKIVVSSLLFQSKRLTKRRSPFFVLFCFAFYLSPTNRDYIEPKVPYVPMRLMCGLMGVAIVPMAFYTVRNSGHSIHAATLAALLVLFGELI
jgi:hypothetical protein